MFSGMAKMILKATVKGKIEEADKRRRGKTILKAGQGYALHGQLQIALGGQRCSNVICSVLTTLQDFGID